ncbi:MAG: hypothetical protein U0172_04960 [Nitrospiraceae bacterium]
MSENGQDTAQKPWTRIPNGTLVRHREGGRQGYIDGLTELVIGPLRNPDGRTQYRVNIGEAERFLAVQDDLLILTDDQGMVLMLKQKPPYRSLISTQLRNAFTADRFVVQA